MKNIIDDANDGDTNYLHGYFKYNSTTDDMNFISIDKSLTIIGEGCIIDGNGKRAFDIYQDVTIKNLNFVNCSSENYGGNYGGAIHFDVDVDVGSVSEVKVLSAFCLLP